MEHDSKVIWCVEEGEDYEGGSTLVFSSKEKALQYANSIHANRRHRKYEKETELKWHQGCHYLVIYEDAIDSALENKDSVFVKQ